MSALLFGLGIPAVPENGSDPVAYGRRAEELGFDFLSVSDHPADSGIEFIDTGTANIHLIALHIDMDQIPSVFPYD